MFTYNDAESMYNGVNLGWSYGLNLTSQKPLFLEFGAEIAYEKGETSYIAKNKHDGFVNEKRRENQINFSVPVVVAYQFSINESVKVAPYTGPNFRVNILEDAGGLDLMNDRPSSNRFQFGWNAGLDFVISKFIIGYRFTGDITSYYHKNTDQYHNVRIGYKF